MKVENELSGIKKNILLKNYTTFKIGGPAKYFFTAKTKTDLIKAIRAAKKYDLPFFILGGGSNLLVADKGFDGLVIKFGQPLSLYVSKGLEWAAGIPGTIEGAVYGNAGAFGKSMEDVVESVEVFDVRTEKIEIFKNKPRTFFEKVRGKDCQFSYKESIFKQNKNLIILSAILKSGGATDINLIKECSDYRKKNHPLNFPSAGCVFENPQLKINNQKLLKELPELKEFNKKEIIPAGYLIEKAGLKGKKIGNVQVSEKHCNFIVNLGDGKAKDVKNLISLIKNKVKKKFGIVLEEEIQYLS